MPYPKIILQELIDLVQKEIMALSNVTGIEIAKHPQTDESYIKIGVKNYHAVTEIREVMKKYAIPEKVWDIGFTGEITAE